MKETRIRLEYIDVIIIDSDVYLLTMSGENLFNMERVYRKICDDKILEVTESDILNDADVFKKIASSGHNPRRFVSFNQIGWTN